MARLVVVPDLFPPPDWSCIIHHGAILPPDSPPWNPGSVLLANVRVIFVPHGRIGTACSKQWHTVSGLVKPSWGTRARSPHEIRPSSWPMFAPSLRSHGRIGTACSKQWHTFRPAQPSRGTRRRMKDLDVVEDRHAVELHRASREFRLLARRVVAGGREIDVVGLPGQRRIRAKIKPHSAPTASTAWPGR